MRPMHTTKLALLAALLCAGANAMACYTVYDANNRVVYNELTPPVDMSQPLHVSLPRRFPGGHMVFDVNGDCPRTNAVGLVLASRAAASNAPAPLLTDASTAAALRLPHTNVTSTIALVPAYAAARLDLPTFTVIPADATALAMARPAMASTAMGAGPAAPAARPRAAQAQAPQANRRAASTTATGRSSY